MAKLYCNGIEVQRFVGEHNVFSVRSNNRVLYRATDMQTGKALGNWKALHLHGKLMNSAYFLTNLAHRFSEVPASFQTR